LSYSAPSILYVGLSQTTSNKSGKVSEPSGGSYTRMAVPNNTESFPAASAGTKSNAIVITFPIPTSDWGTIQSLFVSDLPSGGNILAMADLTTPRPIVNGSSSPKVAVGALYLSHT
jgi:hypothetical protein